MECTYVFFSLRCIFTFNNGLTDFLCLVLQLILMKLSTLSTLVCLSIAGPAADFWRIGTCLCIKTQLCLHIASVNYFQTGCLKTHGYWTVKLIVPPGMHKKCNDLNDFFCANLQIAYV